MRCPSHQRRKKRGKKRTKLSWVAFWGVRKEGERGYDPKNVKELKKKHVEESFAQRVREGLSAWREETPAKGGRGGEKKFHLIAWEGRRKSRFQCKRGKCGSHSSPSTQKKRKRGAVRSNFHLSPNSRVLCEKSGRKSCRANHPLCQQGSDVELSNCSCSEITEKEKKSLPLSGQRKKKRLRLVRYASMEEKGEGFLLRNEGGEGRRPALTPLKKKTLSSPIQAAMGGGKKEKEASRE